MSLKINTEQICSRETLCRITHEQSVELDYVLPDYYPEIFRVIRCTASPSVTSCTVNGDRLAYELSVVLKIIYCGSSGNDIRTVERRLDYSRTADLECGGTSPRVRITPSVEYVNCRAVTGRRIDVRGAVSIAIAVTGETCREAVSDAFGCGILLKKTSVSCPSPAIISEKRVTVSETFPLGEAKPPVADVLRCCAAVTSSDRKLIGDKLAAKGELKINMLYTAASENGNTPETMQFSLPFSQIMDMNGIDDRYETYENISVLSCDIRPRSDGSGDAREVECEVLLLICCTAVKYNELSLASDEFSTACATEHVSEPIKLSLPPVVVDQTRVISGSAEQHEGNIGTVYDVWCEVMSCDTLREEDGSITAAGRACCYCLAQSTGGEPVICTADVPFRFEGISSGGLSADASADISAVPVSCSYNLTSDNSVEIKAELRLTGEICDFRRINVLTSVTADEENIPQSDSDAAVKLYFASKGEDLWDIAKQCRTSPEAIMEENGLDEPVMQENGMIIIPIIR